MERVIDTSRDGNDCYIQEKWMLLHMGTKAIVVRVEYIDSWCGKVLASDVMDEPNQYMPEEAKRHLELG